MLHSFLFKEFKKLMLIILKIKDSSDQPDKYLYTPLAHKINDIVIPKYMSDLFRPKIVKNQVPKDEPINHSAPRSSQNENEKSNQSDKVNSLSQKVIALFFTIYLYE